MKRQSYINEKREKYQALVSTVAATIYGGLSANPEVGDIRLDGVMAIAMDIIEAAEGKAYEMYDASWAVEIESDDDGNSFHDEQGEAAE